MFVLALLSNNKLSPVRHRHVFIYRYILDIISPSLQFPLQEKLLLSYVV